MKSKDKIRGAHAKSLFIPIIITILILLMSFVAVTVFMNKQSEKDANDAHEATECISIISSLQARSSSAAETISSFVYKPKTEPIAYKEVESPPDSGNYVKVPTKYALNTIPLESYYETITNVDLNPHKIYETVSTKYDIGEALLIDLAELVEYLDYMDETQKHAIYLISRMESVDIDQKYLDAIGSYTYTDEDLSYTTDEEIQKAALDVIFEKEYAMKKKTIAEKISNITRILRNESAEIEKRSDNLIWHLRRTLWALVALIIIALVIFFSIMFRKVILPITRYAKDIQNNELLDDEKGLYETNYLARSYNELLDKKSDFEYRLKAVAETDPLTGFENRYSYNKFLATKADSSHPTCIFMLDINNLKYINDTFGHDKGDELIKNSSLAIKETFYSFDKKNCYRLGGDEFIAIMDNIKEDEIESYITKFNEKMKKYKVSIALGYAYTSDISKEGYESLMIEADKKMYEKKKIMKEKGEAR